MAYSRYYGYNLDGSRHTVERNDGLNGAHVDVYAYDPVSGRLASVTDIVPQPDVVHSFAWNPEGTLARWSSDEPNSYARAFGYDEEGRLVKIERDYGSGGAQVAYEYGYNSDGVRVWKRDVLNGQEYRYVCRIGCGGVPMRVYNRPTSGGSWASVEDYLPAGNALGYNQNWRYRYSGGELLMMTASGKPSAYYPMDSNGLAVQNAPAQPCICAVVVSAQTAVCSLLEHGCGDDDEDCLTKCRRDGKTGRDFLLLVFLVVSLLIGCGKSTSQSATQQTPQKVGSILREAIRMGNDGDATGCLQQLHKAVEYPEWEAPSPVILRHTGVVIRELHDKGVESDTLPCLSLHIFTRAVNAQNIDDIDDEVVYYHSLRAYFETTHKVMSSCKAHTQEIERLSKHFEKARTDFKKLPSSESPVGIHLYLYLSRTLARKKINELRGIVKAMNMNGSE